MNNPVNKKEAAGRRIRRTPEQARRLILDAAEACMGADGPAGLRLTEVAARAGVSHPTLLHHFGSRDALIGAVHHRAIEGMRGAVTGAMRAPAGDADIVAMVFAAYRDGLAQRLMWMVQSGFDPPAGGGNMLGEMVDGLHALRTGLAGDGPPPALADTEAIIHLTALVAFADAVIGPRLRNQPDPAGEQAGRAAFERWFAGLVRRAVAGPP